MKIVEEVKLGYDDVLIKPKSSEAASREEVVLHREFNNFPHSNRNLTCVPIIAANMDSTGTFKMAKALKQRDWITCIHKHYPIEDLIDFFGESEVDNVFYTLGISKQDIAKLNKLVAEIGYCPNLCIDVANGYTDHFISKIAKIREKHFDPIIMAGNICTPEMVERIIRQGGADIVKVGVGPGSACTTRIVTGVGYPQLSAVIECADAAHGSSHGFICADGGCNSPGDVCKAFGGNADFVMLGGMLAGTDECEGTWEYNFKEVEKPISEEVVVFGRPENSIKVETGETYKSLEPDLSSKKSFIFYGMSSDEAQEKYNGPSTYRASEGRVVKIPYKGFVDNVAKEIEGGIRSCCTYIGAQEIKHIGRCTTFVRTNSTHNRIYEHYNVNNS